MGRYELDWPRGWSSCRRVAAVKAPELPRSPFGRPRPTPGAVRPSDPFVVVVLAFAGIALAFDLFLTITSGLTFYADEWNVILRTGWSLDSLFTPLNEHIVAGQVVVYKVLLGLFGMNSTAPFRFANTAFLLMVVSLTYVLVARRLGPILGGVIAAVLLLLGPAWEDLLWPAGISFMGAMAGGLAAFAVIERKTRRGEAICCGFLIAGVSFSTLGLAFVVGAVVEVLLRPGERLRRAWVPGIPLALYGLWYAAYGSAVESRASLDNLLGAPDYGLERCQRSARFPHRSQRHRRRLAQLGAEPRLRPPRGRAGGRHLGDSS